MGVIEEIVSGLQGSLVQMGESILDALPGVIVALILLLIGYYTAKYLGKLIEKVLKQAGLESKMTRLGLKKALGGTDLSHIVGHLFRWWIFLLFLQEASAQVTLGVISEFLGALVSTVIPSIFVAVIILLIALLVAEYVSEFIKKIKMKEASLIAAGARLFILYIAVVMALTRIGIETQILTNLFTVIAAAAGLGFALAIGIAFGLGGKKKAEKIWKKLKVK